MLTQQSPTNKRSFSEPQEEETLLSCPPASTPLERSPKRHRPSSVIADSTNKPHEHEVLEAVSTENCENTPKPVASNKSSLPKHHQSAMQKSRKPIGLTSQDTEHTKTIKRPAEWAKLVATGKWASVYRMVINGEVCAMKQYRRVDQAWKGLSKRERRAHKAIRRSPNFRGRVAWYRGRQSSQGRVYFEYIEGQLLDKCAGRMSRSLQKRVFEALTKTVRALHEIGVSHGSIASHNVIIHKDIWSCTREEAVDKHVVLIDFTRATRKDSASPETWWNLRYHDRRMLRIIGLIMADEPVPQNVSYWKDGEKQMYGPSLTKLDSRYKQGPLADQNTGVYGEQSQLPAFPGTQKTGLHIVP